LAIEYRWAERDGTNACLSWRPIWLDVKWRSSPRSGEITSYARNQ
jgi:hypothetical protein